MKKLSAEQIIEKLASIFREVDQFVVADAMAKAKQWLTTEVNRVRENSIAMLLDFFERVNKLTIDATIKKARQQTNAETERISQENLERLFDEQIATMEDRIVPEQIMNMLADQRSLVILKASKITFEEGHIPFLPVIP